MCIHNYVCQMLHVQDLKATCNCYSLYYYNVSKVQMLKDYMDNVQLPTFILFSFIESIKI